MSDLISRQAAIALLSDMRCCVNCFDPMERAAYEALSQAITALKELPSAQPERKKGRWIGSDDFDEYYRCSECGKGETQFDGLYRYCPWCGARMVEREEDE